jgi:zinc transporter
MNDSSVIFSVVLNGKGGVQPEGPDLESGRYPVWMHLDGKDSQVRKVLDDHGIESFVADTMTRVESRPNAVKSGDGLMIILRGINRNAGADPEDMVSIRIWVEPARMVSVRLRPVLATQMILEELQQDRGPTSVAELVIAIIAKIADGIAVFVDDIEERMDGYEEKIEEGAKTEVRGEISAVRRQMAVVRRFLAPQRDALDSLYRYAGDLFGEEEAYALREQSHRMTRYIEDLDLVRERAMVAQEELMNRVAHEQNARTYLFSVVATIFLPITFISGVFGMNTAGLPGLEYGPAFWIVAGVMGIVAAAVIIWLRFKRWF